MKLSAKTVFVTAKNGANDKVATTPFAVLLLVHYSRGLHHRLSFHPSSHRSHTSARGSSSIFEDDPLRSVCVFAHAAAAPVIRFLVQQSPFVLGWPGLLLLGSPRHRSPWPIQHEAEDNHHKKNSRSLQFQT